MKITELTPEQTDRLPVFRAEYLAHGTSTAPADRPRAEAAFARAYRTIGREPVPVLWADSPLSASVMFAILDRLQNKDVAASLGASLEASLTDSLWASLAASLWDSLAASLTDSLEASLTASLWASLTDSLGDSLEASLAASLAASLEDSKITVKNTSWRGQQDLYWIAFYKFCAAIGVKYNSDAADKLDIMHEIGLSCMWWYSFDGLIIACERPSTVALNTRAVLHNDTGPAIAFRDGWKIYAVNGHRVPGWIIETPDQITVEKIDAETNLETRRIMIEKFGSVRYVIEGGGVLIDDDPQHGKLWRRDRQGDSPILMLQVRNPTVEPDGTVREFFLRVHPECRPFRSRDKWIGNPQKLTALNARASTWGLTGKQFAQLAVAA